MNILARLRISRPVYCMGPSKYVAQMMHPKMRSKSVAVDTMQKYQQGWD